MSAAGVVRRWGGGMVTADPWVPGDVAGDLVPSANNTHDIGVASTGEWKDFYLAGDANIGGQVFIADGTAANPALAFTDDVDCGLIRDTYGNVVIVSGASKTAYFGSTEVQFNKNAVPVANNTYDLGKSATRWKDLHLAGAQYMAEMTAPSGTANVATIFAQDNGSGKTQLMVIFGSGAAQQIAIEP